MSGTPVCSTGNTLIKSVGFGYSQRQDTDPEGLQGGHSGKSFDF